MSKGAGTLLTLVGGAVTTTGAGAPVGAGLLALGRGFSWGGSGLHATSTAVGYLDTGLDWVDEGFDIVDENVFNIPPDEEQTEAYVNYDIWGVEYLKRWTGSKDGANKFK